MGFCAALVAVSALAALGTAAGGSPQVADASTLEGKIICGYQGWFACPGDGSDPSIGWRHWSRNSAGMGLGLYNTDTWPDTSEYDPSGLFPVPNTTLRSGGTAFLFSSAKQGVADVHFRWMQECGIDGVLLERFTNGNLLDPKSPSYKLGNRVLGNVQAAAKKYGRVWAVEYDVTGDVDTATIYKRITADWQRLKKTYRLYSDPRYLRHNGKPVVMIFGFGFQGDSYPVTPELAHKFVDYFKRESCWVMAGVPWGWRTLTGGSKTEPAWSSVYRSFNGLKPWTVGAYRSSEDTDRFRREIWRPDQIECDKLGISYLPTAWPRFGWDNMHGYPCGQSKFSSRGGQHLWDQLYEMRRAGARTIYGAMFDECDESTAMMKLSDDFPTGACFWGNEGMPNDWWLRLLGQGGKMLRGESPLTRAIPIKP